MNFLNKLERKFDKFTVPNLYFVIIACLVVGYFFRYAFPSFYENLVLVPYLVVVQNQYWRLFTWIFTIPYDLSSFITILFLPISLFFYYYLGRSLEAYWGRFMYNLYIFGGMFLTNILVVLGGFIYYYWSPDAMAHRDNFLTDMALGGDAVYAGFSVTHYMLISIFLAFSVIGGDNMIYLYFVIPVKMKWLAYLDLIIMLFYFVQGGLFTRLIIIGSIANFFIYFLINRGKSRPTLKQRKVQKNFEKAKQRGYKAKAKHATYNEDGTIEYPGGHKIITPGTGNPKGITIHKCAVCGRTEVDSPDMEFRFCSKCNGNYEYCSEHLYTHQHIS